MRILFTWAMLCLSLCLFAQKKGTQTLIFGNIAESTKSSVRLYITLNQFDGAQVIDEVSIENGEFLLFFKLEKPVLATLKYGNKKLELFLEPGDRLNLTTDNNLFNEAVFFSGTGSGNNSFLVEYRRQYAWHNPDNDALIAPSLRIPSNVYRRMIDETPGEFMLYAQKQHEGEVKFYENNSAKYKITEAMRAYIQNHIQYRWANYKMAFSELSESPLPPDYYDFLTGLSIDNSSALDYYSYTAFLDQYLKLQYYRQTKDSIADAFQKFEMKYQLAKDIFRGESLGFASGRLILSAMTRKNVFRMTPYYEDYMIRNANEKNRTAVKLVYDGAARFSEKAIAPNFTLKNPNNTPISLGSFRGKTVYLSFWASWCKPCIQEMNASKENKARMRGKNIVFLYVSLEKDKERWKRTLKNMNIEGVHVWAGDRKSPVAKAYEVVSLPRYYLINPNGQFLPNIVRAGDPAFVEAMKTVIP